MSLTADSVEYQSEDIAGHAGPQSDLEGSKA
jgi:ABC-2 type transport system ATP-binding protein